jgi:hypothetical protein
MVKQYIAYFRHLAEKNRGIKDFYMMDVDSVVAASAENALSYPCMVLETLRGRYRDDKHDNPLNLITGGFMILDKCATVNDFAREEQILDDTFALGAQVIAKIKQDTEQYEPLAVAALRDFDPNEVKWQQQGPLLENAFGTLFTFPVTKAANLEVNPDDWDNGQLIMDNE